MLGKHFSSCKAHYSSSNSSKHSKFESCQSYCRSPKTCGNKQCRSYWHLTSVLQEQLSERNFNFSTKWAIKIYPEANPWSRHMEPAAFKLGLYFALSEMAQCVSALGKGSKSKNISTFALTLKFSWKKMKKGWLPLIIPSVATLSVEFFER